MMKVMKPTKFTRDLLYSAIVLSLFLSPFLPVMQLKALEPAKGALEEAVRRAQLETGPILERNAEEQLAKIREMYERRELPAFAELPEPEVMPRFGTALEKLNFAQQVVNQAFDKTGALLRRETFSEDMQRTYALADRVTEIENDISGTEGQESFRQFLTRKTEYELNYAQQERNVTLKLQKFPQWSRIWTILRDGTNHSIALALKPYHEEIARLYETWRTSLDPRERAYYAAIIHYYDEVATATSQLYRAQQYGMRDYMFKYMPFSDIVRFNNEVKQPVRALSKFLQDLNPYPGVSASRAADQLKRARVALLKLQGGDSAERLLAAADDEHKIVGKQLEAMRNQIDVYNNFLQNDLRSLFRHYTAYFKIPYYHNAFEEIPKFFDGWAREIYQFSAVNLNLELISACKTAFEERGFAIPNRPSSILVQNIARLPELEAQNKRLNSMTPIDQLIAYEQWVKNQPGSSGGAGSGLLGAGFLMVGIILFIVVLKVALRGASRTKPQTNVAPPQPQGMQ